MMLMDGDGLKYFEVFLTSYWGRIFQSTLLTVVSMICGMMSVCFSSYFLASLTRTVVASVKNCYDFSSETTSVDLTSSGAV